MGDGQVTDSPNTSYTEVFETVFPYYLAMGMTYTQFWDEEPGLAKAYRKAEDIRRKRTNEELWLAGIYTAEALSATVGNMFSKSKKKHNYPAEPMPITMTEIEERREREKKAKMEQLKARMMAKALSINAHMGGK